MEAVIDHIWMQSTTATRCFVVDNVVNWVQSTLHYITCVDMVLESYKTTSI